LEARRPGVWHVLARRDWAGEKSGLFEHPARCSPPSRSSRFSHKSRANNDSCFTGVEDVAGGLFQHPARFMLQNLELFVTFSL
jgi:hypothetical protein